MSERDLDNCVFEDLLAANAKLREQLAEARADDEKSCAHLLETRVEVERLRGILSAVISDKPDSAFTDDEQRHYRARVINAVEANGWLDPSEAAELRGRFRDEGYDIGFADAREAAAKVAEETRLDREMFVLAGPRAVAALPGQIADAIRALRAPGETTSPATQEADHGSDRVQGASAERGGLQAQPRDRGGVRHVAGDGEGARPGVAGVVAGRDEAGRGVLLGEEGQRDSVRTERRSGPLKASGGVAPTAVVPATVPTASVNRGHDLATPPERCPPGFAVRVVSADESETLSIDAPGFTTIRPCRDCGVLMRGGPTRCVCCAKRLPEPPRQADGEDMSRYTPAPERCPACGGTQESPALQSIGRGVHVHCCAPFHDAKPAADATDEPEWRVGRKVGRTLYRHGQLVGLMDTRELAAAVVEALNGTAPDPLDVDTYWRNTAMQALKDRDALRAERDELRAKLAEAERANGVLQRLANDQQRQHAEAEKRAADELFKNVAGWEQYRRDLEAAERRAAEAEAACKVKDEALRRLDALYANGRGAWVRPSWLVAAYATPPAEALREKCREALVRYFVLRKSTHIDVIGIEAALDDVLAPPAQDVDTKPGPEVKRG